MTTDEFKNIITKYLVEADIPSPAPGADPTADPAMSGGAEAPSPPVGTPDSLGGGAVGIGDLGGGMPGDMGSDPNQPGGETKDLCSPRYVALVSYLCELYNLNISNHRTMVLNLKIKVGDPSRLNDVHNATEIFKFMIKYFLNADIIKLVQAEKKNARDTIRELKKTGEYASYVKHNVTSTMMVDVCTLAYTAVCNNALGETLPEINYGIDGEFRVDPKNAKSVYNEIKKNIDQLQKLSEIEES